jgi:hypothetical protein
VVSGPTKLSLVKVTGARGPTSDQTDKVNPGSEIEANVLTNDPDERRCLAWIDNPIIVAGMTSSQAVILGPGLSYVFCSVLL